MLKYKYICLVVSAMLLVVSFAGQDESQAKCQRCGGKGTISVKTTCKKCGGQRFCQKERVTKYRRTFAGTNVRKFNDGQAGTERPISQSLWHTLIQQMGCHDSLWKLRTRRMSATEDFRLHSAMQR